MPLTEFQQRGTPPLLRDAIATAWQRLRKKFQPYHCPICDRYLKRFDPSDGFYWIRNELIDHATKQSICPICKSGIRHRFVFQYVKQSMAEWPAGAKVLHIAPEPPIQQFFLQQPGLDYVAGDLRAEESGGSVPLDILDIAFESERFDVIVCIHVLEHIDDDRQAIRELSRVLKPGGELVLAVPIYGETTFEDATLDEAARGRMYGIADHRRLNGLDLKEKLKAAGLDVAVYSIADVPGDYVDRKEHSPHIESDQYLFSCRKLGVSRSAAA